MDSVACRISPESVTIQRDVQLIISEPQDIIILNTWNLVFLSHPEYPVILIGEEKIFPLAAPQKADSNVFTGEVISVP